ncbi:MAG: SprT-like domain-containing protein [Pyrinomonadaceae bacterium]|jgi:hypothetical protein
MTEIDQIKNIYQEAFRKLSRNGLEQKIEVQFYPYVGINHTIRVRNGTIYVRISDIFKNAPSEVQNSLAYILISKLLGKKISPEIINHYKGFVKSEEIFREAAKVKRTRGRKIIASSKGEFYDLEKIFVRINRDYFNQTISKPTLTWSKKKTFRILGQYDSTHNLIVISKSLDNKKVPAYVVEFVVFHEMLHIFHPPQQRAGRRYHHTPKFRSDEEKFACFTEAENWIQQNINVLKRNAKID